MNSRLLYLKTDQLLPIPEKHPISPIPDSGFSFHTSFCISDGFMFESCTISITFSFCVWHFEVFEFPRIIQRPANRKDGILDRSTCITRASH